MYGNCCYACCGGIYSKYYKKGDAATPGYFNDYDHDMVNKFSLEQNDGYDCLQGMSIYGDLAFYAKFKYVKDEANENHKVGIWAYNLKSGKKYKVYNGSSLTNAVFKLGHANCLFVNKNNLYVATGVAAWPISRYDLHIDGSNIYLTNRKNFKMPSGVSEAAYGIEYAGSMNQFLVRGLTTIYAGNFEGDRFVCNKKYKIGTSVNINGENVDITLRDPKNGGFTHQGIYYKDGNLYLPMINNRANQQSLVVAYKLNSNTANGATLQARNDMVVRITSNQAFPNLFEIEAVSCYNGEMYFAVNARKKGDIGCDFLSKVKGFRF